MQRESCSYVPLAHAENPVSEVLSALEPDGMMIVEAPLGAAIVPLSGTRQRFWPSFLWYSPGAHAVQAGDA